MTLWSKGGSWILQLTQTTSSTYAGVMTQLATSVRGACATLAARLLASQINLDMEQE